MTIIKSETIAALSTSLAIAQGEIGKAHKSKDNPFFKSKYADLASVWDACRDALSKNGLSIVQLPGQDSDKYFLDTILLHKSGEYISSRYFFRVLKDDPQGLGSAITYARRYALQAIAGIAPDDDDGEAAMDRGGKARAAEVKASKKQTPEENQGSGKLTSDGELLPPEATVWRGTTINDLQAISGESRGKPWTYYEFKFEEDASKTARTFSESLYNRGKILGAAGERVDATVIPGKKENSWEIVDIVESETES
jgi:hypothetical protein